MTPLTVEPMWKKLVRTEFRKSKDFLKFLYYTPLDVVDVITGARGDLVPPRRLMFVGSGDFTGIGDEFLQYFKEIGSLRPDHTVLDVGCGIGRMAVPLTTFLTNGKYEGFDIVRKGINWCSKSITPRYPNFRFQQADIYNKLYNPKGQNSAATYTFPYEDSTFDFVFLVSVFTHMLPLDLRNYMSEIVRVLKRKGRAFITYFLVNDDSNILINEGKSYFRFVRSSDGFWTISQGEPESAVAYDEEYIRDLYRMHGMRILTPVRYGSWAGRQRFLSFQDIVVAEK
jgi:SAM-dependent methyltransferase